MRIIENNVMKRKTCPRCKSIFEFNKFTEVERKLHQGAEVIEVFGDSVIEMFNGLKYEKKKSVNNLRCRVSWVTCPCCGCQCAPFDKGKYVDLDFWIKK